MLVPLDGSEFAERAVPIGATLARDTGAALILVTTRWYDSPVEPREYLERTRTELAPAAVTRVVLDRSPGQAAEAIAAVANEQHPATVCMTTHGRSGLRWAILGSVAETVLHDTAEPVVLVGRRCRPAALEHLRELVLCVDGSQASERSIESACDWAERLGLVVVPVRVVDPSDFEGVTPIESILDPVVERVQARGLTAHPLVVRSSYPAGALLDVVESTPAALVAMSSHGRTGYARVAVGSVTMAVVSGARCPVLVTRALT
jgi:nucleotide-binding universal stress UspA family protein